MSTPGPNIAASIQGRLKHVATQRQEDYQRVLMRYASERLLYRLSLSRHPEKFVLKGAALLAAWTSSPFRATRDIDLLGLIESGVENLRVEFAEIFQIQIPEDDGLRFLPDSVQSELIRKDQEHGGVRVQGVALLGKSKIALQIDIGFGDAITPGPVSLAYPTLLKQPPAMLQTYPPETVVGEKLDALVCLGMSNSRMKDFYDLRVLSQTFNFESTKLSSAIRATFLRRGTLLPTDKPVALTDAFAMDPTKRNQWRAFLTRADVEGPCDWNETLEAISTFAWPAMKWAASRSHTAMTWSAKEFLWVTSAI